MSELQLNSLAKALEADRAAFRLLANAIPNFVWLAREDGSIVFLNEPMLAYTGLADEEAVASRFLTLVYPDDLTRVYDTWRESIATGNPFETEHRLRRAADDTYLWFLSRARPVRDTDGNIAYWLGTSTDIDTQKRATENLAFVIDASELLAAATSVEEISSEFARAAASRFADWCFIVLTDPQVR